MKVAKDVWVQRVGATSLSPTRGGVDILFRDRVGNFYRVVASKNAKGFYEYMGTLEPKAQNQKAVVTRGGKKESATVFWPVTFPQGVNIWVFHTDQNGQLTRIVWYNVGIMIAKPNLPANSQEAKEADARRQAEVQTTMQAIALRNAANPEKANQEMDQYIRKNPGIINPKEINIQSFDVKFQ